MANLEGMPISALPELTGDLQDEDEVVVYRPSTGKAYQANTDLIDSLTEKYPLIAKGRTTASPDDFTSISDNGYYYYAGDTDVLGNESTPYAGLISVIFTSSSTSYGIQILITNRSSGSLYFRHRIGSPASWGAWKLVTSSAI